MPEGRHSPPDICPTLTYDDAPAAIEWLCRAFGFRRRFVVLPRTAGSSIPS